MPKKPQGLWKASWCGAHHQWFAVRNGARPDTHQREEFEPGGKRGWQHEAASRVDQRFRDEDLFVRLTNSGQALVRSQGAPGAGPGHMPNLSNHEDRTSALSHCPFSPPQCPRVSAAVAFHSIFVATTGQLAQGLGSWEGGGTRWRP